MKKSWNYILISILIASCSNVDSDWINSNSDELKKIYIKATEHGFSSVHSNDINEIAFRLRDLKFDKMLIYYDSSNTFITADSLVVFIKHSSNILETEKRIIYDFASQPRKFGNEELTNASYSRKQIKERWYLETEGFD